jgi:hypothetical protein
MEGMLDLVRRDQMPDRERNTCSSVLLGVTLKETLFSDEERAQAQEWLTLIEGTRSRRPVGDHGAGGGSKRGGGGKRSGGLRKSSSKMGGFDEDDEDSDGQPAAPKTSTHVSFEEIGQYLGSDDDDYDSGALLVSLLPIVFTYLFLTLSLLPRPSSTADNSNKPKRRTGGFTGKGKKDPPRRRKRKEDDEDEGAPKEKKTRRPREKKLPLGEGGVELPKPKRGRPTYGCRTASEVPEMQSWAAPFSDPSRASWVRREAVAQPLTHDSIQDVLKGRAADLVEEEKEDRGAGAEDGEPDGGNA